MEEEASAELISPRISFSHDLATFDACPASTRSSTPSRPDTSFFLLSRRRRRVPAEPEFDFANSTADDVAPADRLFADGKLLPLPPLPPTTPHARVKHPQPPPWQKATTRPAPRSWASPFVRSSSVNSAATATASASGGRFTCPAFPLKRSQSAGHRPHCKKVAPATAPTAGSVHSSGGAGGGGARSVYYYGHGGSRNGRASGGVRVSPVLNVTSIGTSVVNMLSYLLCDCGEMKGTKSRGFGVNCWVTN